MRAVVWFAVFSFLLLALPAVAQDYGTGAFQEDEGVSLPSFPSTPAAQSQAAGQQAQTEAGDVSVLVKSAGQPAVGAQVKLSCYGTYGSSIQITDSFGAALFHFVPVGQCQVITNYQQSGDSKQITVSKGEIKTVEFDLRAQTQNSNQTLANAQQDIKSTSPLVFFGYLLLGVFVLGIIILSIFIAYKLIRKAIRKARKSEETQIIAQPVIQEAPQLPTPQQQAAPVQEQKEEQSQRTKDILKILDDKEKQVVKFLLENDHSCSQAKIFYGTGIKRTTLHRIIDALAAKKILQVEKRAKARYVSLTDWFLGKETEATENTPKS